MMVSSTFRFWSYAVLAIAFLYSLLLAAEFDLVAFGTPSRGHHDGIELEELLGLSGVFSLLLAGIAMLNGVFAHRERSERSAAERIANLDALTSIANRRCFFERLEAAHGRSRHGAACAVLLMDLDGFKAINDSHGHGAGDVVLIHVAHQIAALAGPGAIAARLGGDEFAMLVEGSGASPKRMVELADKVKRRVGEPLAFRGVELQVGASIGIGFASSTTATPAAIVEAADGAMYHAKRKNRDLAAA
jgi:diguanylate cyclase (GGDEF)-like protein